MAAWDEVNPEDGDSSGQGATEMRNFKIEVRKRMNKLVEDWTIDPDISQTYIKTAGIKDAAVTTGKIADLNVTAAKLAAAAVETAKIKALNVTGDKLAAILSGNHQFSGTITDKNGNEVIAMQVETKRATGVIAADTEGTIVVSGFSFNPTGVLVCYVAVVNVGAAYNQTGIGGGGGGGSGTPTIRNITFGTGSVSVTLLNDLTSSETFSVIVTACRT